MAKIPKSRIKNEERAALALKHKTEQERLKEGFYKRQNIKIIEKIEDAVISEK